MRIFSLKEEPVLGAWQGLKYYSDAKNESISQRFMDNVVSAQDYFEEGERVFAKFVLWLTLV